MIRSFRELGVPQNEITVVDWDARVDRSGPLPSRPWWQGASRESNIKHIVKSELPALAVIIAFMAKRPAWEEKEPFEVPDELYERGEMEMRDHMKKRGFPLPIDKNLDRPNFMVLGTPVVATAANG